MNKYFPGHRPIAFVLFGFGWFFFVFSAYILLYVLFKHDYLPGYGEDNSDPVGYGLAIISGFVIWAMMMRATTILGTSLRLEEKQILITSWYGRTERITNTIQGVDCNVSLSLMPGVRFDVPNPYPNVIRIKTSNREYYLTVDNKTTKDELLALLSTSLTGMGSLQQPPAPQEL